MRSLQRYRYGAVRRQRRHSTGHFLKLAKHTTSSRREYEVRTVLGNCDSAANSLVRWVFDVPHRRWPDTPPALVRAYLAGDPLRYWVKSGIAANRFSVPEPQRRADAATFENFSME